MNTQFIIISVVFMIILILYFKRNIKENFAIEKNIDKYMVANNAVEKCDILDINTHNDEDGNPIRLDDINDNVSALINIKTLIDSGRIKKFKNKNLNSDLKNDKVYCYIDNDIQSNTKDILLNTEKCDMNNKFFKENTLITDVFEHDDRDNIYTLPYSKCVFEIDPKQINKNTLKNFYNRFDTNVSCQDKITSIINNKDNITREFYSLQNAYNDKDNLNHLLLNGIDTLDKNNVSCSENLKNTIFYYDDIKGKLDLNTRDFNKFDTLSKKCETDLHNNKIDRENRIAFYLEEKDKLTLEIKNKELQLGDCKENNEINQVEKDKYIRLNRQLNYINGIINNDNVRLNNEFRQCTVKKNNEDQIRITNKDNYNNCVPFIQKLIDCNTDLRICSAEYNECIPERDFYDNAKEVVQKEYKKCVNDYDDTNYKYKRCISSVEDLKIENDRLLKEIDEKTVKKEIINEEVIDCNTKTEANENNIVIVQETNTKLFNELNRFKTAYNKDVEEAISNKLSVFSIENTTIRNKGIDEFNKKVEELKKSSQGVECMVGMVDCIKADPINMNGKIIDNTVFDIENEQYCAEQCVKEDSCKAIYFKNKKCYLLNSHFENNDRVIKEDSGYSANFMPSYRIKNCPTGAYSCMYAKGVSTIGDNILDKKDKESFEVCINECRFTDSCKSVSFDNESKSCYLFKSFYDEYNDKSDPKRFTTISNPTKYLSASINLSECFPTQFGPWSPCVGLDENCIGTQSRTKPSGGQKCPAVTETNACTINIRSKEEVNKLSNPEAGVVYGKARRRKWKNRCNYETIESTEDVGWSLDVWQDNNRSGGHVNYKGNNEQIHYRPFGVSSWELKGKATLYFSTDKSNWKEKPPVYEAANDFDLEWIKIVPDIIFSGIPFENYPEPKK